MNFLTAPLGSMGLLAVVYLFFILANLSRRYGQVIRLPAYYRVFYVAMGFVALAFVSHLIQDSVIIAPDEAPAGHKKTEHYRRWRDTVEEMMAEPRSNVKYDSVFPEEADW